MADYGTNDPKGWCGDPRRGAAMGRPTILGQPESAISIRRSYLSGGYDRNGTYFGMGQPLFWYADESGNVDAMERADSIEDVLAEVRKRYPTAMILLCSPVFPLCEAEGCEQDSSEYSDYCEHGSCSGPEDDEE